jgi:hypothetical protein
MIPGTEGPSIPELNLAAEKFQTLTEKATEAARLADLAQADLVNAMKAAKLTVYRDNEAVPPLLISLTLSEREKLKIRAVVPVESRLADSGPKAAKTADEAVESVGDLHDQLTAKQRQEQEWSWSDTDTLDKATKKTKKKTNTKKTNKKEA